ncbi:syntaxin-17 isoform X1 [Tenebrio molitor]|jgi:syntaxin 17|uniref:syntaxin-17 isoform X1 n=1 Tax=Tenebrio molitor TaxID=7067 RepID=UPI003624753D
MSVLNTSITKQPLKLIEVPLNKFSEEVIPHHQSIFEQHRTCVLKLMSKNNIQIVQQEIKSKKRVIKQLKDLMYELDTLRTQVEDVDLDKFDTKTLSFRKIIITLISGYTDLEKKCAELENRQNEEDQKLLEETSPFEGASQIQIHENLDDVVLRQRQELLNEVETVHKETEDLNQIYTQLHQMVEDQKEHVDQAEEKVESAHENVHAGFKDLVKAHRYSDDRKKKSRFERFLFRLKTAVYPVTGAFLGSMIGGPVGLVAGFKIGGLTALGCAIAGYTGGRFFKKSQAAEEVQEQTTEVPDDGQVLHDCHDKKDI